MLHKDRLFFGALLAVAAMVTAFVPGAASRLAQATDDSIPAFHEGPPQGELPATLPPELFGSVVVQNAYTLAAKVKKILYQQPCYCHCDRSVGHASLLDCFASKHGSGCDVCMKEAIYSYEQSRKGKTAAQIRTGIESGEWRRVDMTKYQHPLSAN